MTIERISKSDFRPRKTNKALVIAEIAIENSKYIDDDLFGECLAIGHVIHGRDRSLTPSTGDFD